jgi:hypothetical protein
MFFWISCQTRSRPNYFFVVILKCFLVVNKNTLKVKYQIMQQGKMSSKVFDFAYFTSE